jgi:hypothetical protein
MKRKRKIILTESQFEVIKESENHIDDFKTFVEDAVKVLNAQFGRLAFASMADVLDGDIDLDVIERKLSELGKVHRTKWWNVHNFIHKKISHEEYEEKYMDVDLEIEELDRKIMDKMDAIEELIDVMKKLGDMDVEKYFSDIETRKI